MDSKIIDFCIRFLTAMYKNADLKSMYNGNLDKNRYSKSQW